MADNAAFTPGSGGTLATFDTGTAEWPANIIGYVTGGSSGSWAIQHVTSSLGLPISDAGGSLTVDAPVGTPVFVRLSDGSSAISTLPVSLASVPTHAVTQSGAWTVDLGATDNAVLDAIAASLAGTLTVGSHAVTNAGTFAVQVDGSALTSLQLIDDGIATAGAAITSKGMAAVGTDGTNARIIKTDSSGELQVDVLTMPTTTVTGTIAVTQSGTWDEVGINDSGNSITVDDGGSSLTVDGTVGVSGTVTIAGAVTNAGTFAVQVDGAALTALQLIDDPVATLGTTTYTEASTKGMIVGAVRRDADTTLVDTTNEVGPLQMNAAGQLKVEVFSGEALPVTMTSTTITGTVAVTQSGTWDEVGINDSGNSITVDNNGTFAVQAVCTNAGTFAVQAACTNAGTFVVQENGAALTALQLIDDGVYTDDTSTHSTGSSKGYGIMAVAAPSDASVNANDFGHVAMTTDRKMHVAVMDALPAGTNNLGLIDIAYIAAGTNNIGDVDVVSVVPGTGATNLGKAEDAAHSSGDVGVMALVVRQDSQSDLGADGDYVPMTVDADGGLRVSIVAGAGSGGTAAADDADFSAGTTAGTPVMGVYESSPTSVTDGDLGTVGITQTRALKVQAQANSGVDIGDVTINNATIAVTQSGTWDEVGINDSGNSITVDNGGTFAVQVTSLPASTNTIEVVGDAAHDAAISGNPVRVGVRAETALSGITLVADGDTTDLYAGVDGVQIVRNHCNLEDIVSGVASNTDGSSTEVIAAAGSGIKIYLTSVTLINAHASTFGYVELKSGTTVRWRLPVPPSGGVTFTFDPPLPPNAANEAWNFDPSAAITTLYASINGFKSKV